MLFARFRAGGAFLAFFEDDYFYYLRVARNIAGGHGSTYDGIHLTNGYHPLWMLLNVALAKLFAGRVFYSALLTVIFGCVLSFYWFTRLTLLRYAGELAASGCALLIATQALELMSTGMEIVLSLPLLAVLCWYRNCRFQWRPSSAAVYGLLCAALVLSRLDAAILVALLVLLELLTAFSVHNAPKLRIGLAFAAGLLPLAVYFGINFHFFHTLMPVSGQAKQLRLAHAPSILPIKDAWFQTPWMPLRELFTVPATLAALIAAALYVRRGGERLLPEHRALVWALLLFPFVHLAVLSVASDWPIWPWYLYPFIAAVLGAALVLLSRGKAYTAHIPHLTGSFALAAGCALLALLSFMQWRNAKRTHILVYSMYWAAEDLRAFAQTHPGVYAMGDRAGTVGILVNQPIVQLEGLVMDKEFLTNLRQQRELHDVLRSYGVRYYVASNPRRVGSCFHAVEPMKAGPTAPVMQGDFCSVPLAHFFHNGYDTYVFDMDRE